MDKHYIINHTLPIWYTYFGPVGEIYPVFPLFHPPLHPFVRHWLYWSDVAFRIRFRVDRRKNRLSRLPENHRPRRAFRVYPLMIARSGELSRAPRIPRNPPRFIPCRRVYGGFCFGRRSITRARDTVENEGVRKHRS